VGKEHTNERRVFEMEDWWHASLAKCS
jgi:hypothetical protein